MSAFLLLKPLPLALAVSLAASCWPVTKQALAQPITLTSDREQAQLYDFNLPVQPLGRSLTQIAGQAQLSLSVGVDLVREVQAPAIQGRLTIQHAWRRALAGTGLAVRQTASGAWTLVKEAPGEVLALETLTVRGARDGVTEGTGAYTTSSMSTATPLSLSMRETPQSVSVVTRERMTDGGMTTVEDALAFTTGLIVQATGGERNSYSARGFGAANIQVDGLAIDHDADTVGSASLAMYDRIEVVRGATGLLEGSGNPSASVNLVRKRPTAQWQTTMTAALGRWDDYAGSVDTGGPLNAVGTLRGRAVAYLQDADTFTKGYRHERKLFYGILEADLSESTLLTLGGYYNREDNPGADWNGLPARGDGSFYDFDSSVRSSPIWSYWNKKNANLFGEIKHTFDNDWVVSLKGQHLDGKLDMLGTSLIMRDAADTFTYNVGQYRYHHKQTSVDARVTGPVQWLGRTHQLAAGLNYRRRVDTDGPGGWPSAYAYGFDPSNWQATIDPPQPGMDWLWSRNAKVDEYGAYFTGKFNALEGFNVFLGGRFSWYELDQTLKSASYVGLSAYDVKANFTPYAALAYDISDQYTVYGSVTSIFKPQDYVAASGALLDPVKGRNYELGIKGEYLDGRLNASLAIFQIDQSNLPDSLPLSQCQGGQSCYSAVGAVRSRGVEVELSGNLTDDWSVFAGYAYQKAEYRKDSVNGKAGEAYGTTTPRHLFTLSTVYKLPGVMADWRVGASMRFQSAIHNTVATYAPVRQSGYGIVNVMAGYSPSAHLDVRLNINNLLGKRYYRAVGYPDNANLLGEPRSFMLTAQYKF